MSDSVLIEIKELAMLTDDGTAATVLSRAEAAEYLSDMLEQLIDLAQATGHEDLGRALEGLNDLFKKTLATPILPRRGN